DVLDQDEVEPLLAEPGEVAEQRPVASRAEQEGAVRGAERAPLGVDRQGVGPRVLDREPDLEAAVELRLEPRADLGEEGAEAFQEIGRDGEMEPAEPRL